MRELYEAPELEIVKFEAEDVISTSCGIDSPETPVPDICTCNSEACETDDWW